MNPGPDLGGGLLLAGVEEGFSVVAAEQEGEPVQVVAQGGGVVGAGSSVPAGCQNLAMATDLVFYADGKVLTLRWNGHAWRVIQLAA